MDSRGRNERADVLGCAIDRVDMADAVRRAVEAIEKRAYVQHMAVNAAKLVTMQDDHEMRRITDGCELVTADGQAVVWASKLLGDPLPERVAGIDLMERLFELSEERGYRVYILGARQEVLERAVAELRRRHPGLQFAGYRDGYFADHEEEAVADAIAEARADLLFVAMSSPRKEYFLGRHGPRMGVPFVMGVGGAIDVMAGQTRRAPRWMQVTGLEWLFRLLQEPRRMFGRYVRSNGRFIRLVAAERVRRARAAG